jgi:hypothetical protein
MSLSVPYTTPAKEKIPQLFHISFNGKLPKVLSPKLPDGSELHGDVKSDSGIEKENKFPEPDWIKRISFSTSLLGAVRATYPNWWMYFEDEKYNYPYVDMWVYEPLLTEKTRLVKTETLSELRLVWDAVVTHEWWILDPVKVRRVGKIKVHNANKEGPLYIFPFGDRSLEKVEAGPEKFRIT